MSEESKTVHDLKALGITLGEGEAKPRRHRKPSLARTIKSAEKSGKAVTSITTADGITLHFGSDGNAATNEWDEALSVKN
jgi:hypothetical protein